MKRESALSPTFKKKDIEFIERAQEIRNPEKEVFHEIGYWARVWVQGALPHTDPGNLPVWGRENGAFSLTVQPGMDVVDGRPVNYGIPFGSIPRLILCWMVTEAVRKQDPKLFLGDSLAEFMHVVGVGRATGGRWGSITRLKDQMRRLTEAKISYRYRGDAVARKDLRVSKEDVLWWSDKEPQQGTLFRSYVHLDDDFFREIITRPVPIKLEALRMLQRSPLALDLYTWLTFRVYRLEQPVAIAWKTLAKQLGSNYSSTEEFAQNAKLTLRKIRLIYPELRIDCPRGRLKIYPSPLHVAPRPSRSASSRRRSLAR